MLATSWSGPLPPPEVLQQFEIVLPGSAERLFKMVEHKQVEERRLNTAVIHRDWVGAVVAAVIGLALVGASIYFFAKGNNIAGPVLLGIPGVLMVQSFLGRRGTKGGGGPAGQQ